MTGLLGLRVSIHPSLPWIVPAHACFTGLIVNRALFYCQNVLDGTLNNDMVALLNFERNRREKYEAYFGTDHVQITLLTTSYFLTSEIKMHLTVVSLVSYLVKK